MKHPKGPILWLTVTGAFCAPLAIAGPYSLGINDNGNVYDAPVPGFTGPHGAGKARLDDGEGNISNPDNRVNPLFFAWASGYSDYQRSDNDASFDDPELSLGPVTGDNFDVVSLGDMTAAQITAGNEPGRITLHFTKPIKNLSGADFVIFENGFFSNSNQGGAGIGGVFAELAYVEVSADGVNFRRFDSTSLTPAAVGGYGTVNPTNIHNLAGKHVNAYGESWGTPFDLSQVGLAEISHIRIVDIPGNGAFKDRQGNPIYDSWRTFGSGGFDLEAVGSISTLIRFSEWPALAELPANQRGPMNDPDGDGIPNLLEYAFCLSPGKADAPNAGWHHEVIQERGAGFVEIVSTRDERLQDLVREIQVTEDLGTWTTIAKSIGGAAYLPENGFFPAISHTSKSEVASVGVIRQDRIRDTRPMSGNTKRFYRVKISRIEP